VPIPPVKLQKHKRLTRPLSKIQRHTKG